MKMDAVIKRRFEELEQKAQGILQAKVVGFVSTKGEPHYTVNSASLKGWMTSALNLLQRTFGEQSVHYCSLSAQYDKFTSPWESVFSEYLAIFLAAKEDYEGGFLFTVRGLVKAEVFDDVLEQAAELLRAGYKDPACVMVGVTLEIAVKELCDRQAIPHGKLDKMNADLCKAGLYNMGMQKQITAWAERRNKAAHGDWSSYSAADVDDMLKGVTRFIAENL